MSMRDNSPEGQRNRKKIVDKAIENWKKETKSDNELKDCEHCLGTGRVIDDDFTKETIPCENCNGIIKSELIKKLNRNSMSVIFIEWLIKQPFNEFRIFKQTDNHYIIHPLNKDGETFDLKW